MREGKFVKIVAPGGATLNFVGVTGTTEKVLMEISGVARLLDRGCQVFEIKEEAAEEGKEPKITYTPLYNNFNLVSGVEIFTAKQVEELTKRGFKECHEDNGGNKQIDSEELEDIFIPDIESILEALKSNEENDRINAIGEKLKKEIKEKDDVEFLEEMSEEEYRESVISARFKKHFKDLEAEEKAKEAEAAKTEEDRAKETALDKGIVYRQLPRFGNKPSSSSFRYNEEGGIEEDATDKPGVNPKPAAGAGEDEHTTSPSTTERTESGEATHEAAPGNTETTGSTTSGKPGKKKNGTQPPEEATSPGRRAEDSGSGLVQPEPELGDHL